MNDASIQVQKLVQSLAISPMAESKLKMEEKDTTDEFLSALTN